MPPVSTVIVNEQAVTNIEMKFLDLSDKGHSDTGDTFVRLFAAYTTQNYHELNQLIQRVETDDDTHLFQVLAVPSNIFGRQVNYQHIV